MEAKPTDSLFKSLRNWILVDGFNFVCDLEKSQGSKLVDKHSGRTYLDFFGGFGSSPLGFNHPKLCNDEFIERAKNAIFNKISNADLYSDEYEEFVRTFGTHALPEGYNHVFFIDGGALAVENGLKAAFDWKVRRNRAKGISADVGTKVIHFKHAFHGRSGYTMSLTNTDPTKTAYFPKFELWPRISSPAIHDDPSTVVQREQIALKEIDEAFDKYGDDIAAIIIEPIQCEGGDRHFRKEFLKALEQRCHEYECLLIFDEVQTGFFTSGKRWCFQHYDVKPDIVCFGKKSQQCGFFAGQRIDEVKGNVFETSSRINSTWGGNLLDMVRATRIMEIIKEDRLEENAAEMGKYWLENMQNKIAPGFDFISNVRGLGLIMAFDLPTKEKRNEFLALLEQKGLVALPCGTRTIRFRPHLAVTQQDMDECLSIISSALYEFQQRELGAAHDNV